MPWPRANWNGDRSARPAEGGAGHLQRGDGLALVLVERLRLAVVGVFGPAHPDLADRQPAERLGRGEEARDVVPVLMGDDHHVEPVGPFGDVGDDCRHRCRCRP